MVDHGADAATVIANAATDITKGVMQISASGLKQLFLLLYEGKSLKVGETNIEKLIKMLDAGDSINDTPIPKANMSQFVELAQKHGVTYAVAEVVDEKMIVYFPDSQSNRVQNIIKDMQNEINKNSEREELDGDDKKDTVLEKQEDETKSIEGLKFEGNHSLSKEKPGEKTVVYFDGKNPNQYTMINCITNEKGENITNCFLKKEGGVSELVDYTSAGLESYNYKQRMHFEVEGGYKESKIAEHINKICADISKQDKIKENIVEKENIIDNILARNSTLDGSIHTVYDASNKNNMIMVFKKLEPFEDGEFKTTNKVMVFVDGQLVNDITPKQAILTYKNYKTMEKHGKSADKQLNKILSGEYFNKNSSKEGRDESNVNEKGERKSLLEYEKEVEKIKALDPKNLNSKEISQQPIQLIKDTKSIVER